MSNYVSNKQKGSIKLYRSLMDKPWYKNSKYVHLWVHLLMKAADSEKEVEFEGRIVKLKKGQLITTRKQLSEETGISETTIERILKRTEVGQQTDIRSNHRNRMITITMYDEYQEGGQKSDRSRTSNFVNPPKKKKPKLSQIDPSFFTGLCPFFFDDDFVEVWGEYETVREAKKGIKSERAYTRILNFLMKESKGNKDVAKEIVAQSADSGWSDLYPLKNKLQRTLFNDEESRRKMTDGRKRDYNEKL